MGTASTAGDRCAQQENNLSPLTVLNLDILQSFLKHLFHVALSKPILKKEKKTNRNHVEERLKDSNFTLPWIQTVRRVFSRT